jgi:hypothetical protein
MSFGQLRRDVASPVAEQAQEHAKEKPSIASAPPRMPMVSMRDR